MNVKTKVIIIVSSQVALIIASFLILIYLESEWLLLGDSIDVAGLNRYLTSNVILEIHDLIHETDADPTGALQKLKENIYFLKEGGEKEGRELKHLPEQFENRWNEINEKYLELEKSLKIVLELNATKVVEEHRELEIIAMELIRSSDLMVKELAEFTEEIDRKLIFLEFLLLVVNTAVHVGLVVMIFRLLDKGSREKIEKEKLATIGEIGASLAHDLRNPLAVIKGSAELLKTRGDDKIDEFHEHQFKKIMNAVDRITHQTRDVLDFVKTKPLNKEKVSIKEIIKKSLQNVKIPEDVKISFPEKDEDILVDKDQFEVVITNLILNSIQAIKGKGTIKIKIKKTDSKTIIDVTDSGTGIPDKYLVKIFEPLVTTKQEGTGLGLVSCKRIVEGHGGKITAENNPTTFRIELPSS